MGDVVKLTASHYFGIVPLHQNTEHQHAYLQTASALLSSIPSAQRDFLSAPPRPPKPVATPPADAPGDAA